MTVVSACPPLSQLVRWASSGSPAAGRAVAQVHARSLGAHPSRSARRWQTPPHTLRRSHIAPRPGCAARSRQVRADWAAGLDSDGVSVGAGPAGEGTAQLDGIVTQPSAATQAPDRHALLQPSTTKPNRVLPLPAPMPCCSCTHPCALSSFHSPSYCRPRTKVILPRPSRLSYLPTAAAGRGMSRAGSAQ